MHLPAIPGPAAFSDVSMQSCMFGFNPERRRYIICVSHLCSAASFCKLHQCETMRAQRQCKFERQHSFVVSKTSVHALLIRGHCTSGDRGKTLLSYADCFPEGQNSLMMFSRKLREACFKLQFPAIDDCQFVSYVIESGTYVVIAPRSEGYGRKGRM